MGKAMYKLGSETLVIATHNSGKLREISALLAPYGLNCISAGSLGLPEPAETGKTFVENALIKARAASESSGLPALADDSGLCVDALGGRPGVYTADWAERQWFEGPVGRDWFMAMGKVEGLLCEAGTDASRVASFNSTLAIAWPDGRSVIYEGHVTGSLVWPPRGDKGFGYDPVFQPLGSNRTYGEMDWEEKKLTDHRAAALALLVAEQFAG